jgi:Rrf2 family protein
MKITAKIEYGLRIMVRIARCKDEKGLSIRQISEADGISKNYAAKLTRILRMKGLIKSTRGQTGGYVLAKPATEITINDILQSLDGTFFDKKFCDTHTGIMKVCTNSEECSIRSLWSMVKYTLDELFNKITLSDLTKKEKECSAFLQKTIAENANEILN